MHSILKASFPSRGMMGFSQMLHTGANFLEGKEPTLARPQKLAVRRRLALVHLPELFQTCCYVTAPGATTTNAYSFLARVDAETCN